MSIPLRAMCYYEGERGWWITLNHGMTWTRAGGDWITVTGDQLVIEAHGLMDQECWKLFPRSQHARFHPASQA